MKKQLFYSILAAGSLFFGGMTAYALTEKAPSVPAKAVLEGSEWVFSPVSGGTTATLPNSQSKVFSGLYLYNGWDRGRLRILIQGKSKICR